MRANQVIVWHVGLVSASARRAELPDVARAIFILTLLVFLGQNLTLLISLVQCR